MAASCVPDSMLDRLILAACCRMRVLEPVTRLVLVQMGKTDPQEPVATGRYGTSE
jgi:hypothetical protein